jgi:hypothetical protein
MFRVAFLLAAAVIVVEIVTWRYSSERRMCSSQAARMNKEHSFDWLQGCMVNTRDGWVSIQSYRGFDP